MKFCSSVLLAALAALLLPTTLPAVEETSLINDKNPVEGWSFNNGPEFGGGAKGGLFADDSVEPQRRPAFRLEGDFTGAGNYVDFGRDLPPVDLEAISFWIKTTGETDTIVLRVIDGTGQCHQINLRIEKHDRWQRVVFPIAKYFEKAGTSSAVDIVTRYEGWGGAKDGKWHNPVKGIHFLCGRGSFGEGLKGSFLFSGMKITAAPPRQLVTKTVRLDDILEEGEVDWSVNLGWEFDGGAKGKAEVLEDDTERNGLHFAADFTEHGVYTALEHSLDGMDVTAVRMKVRTPNATSYNIRYIDATGQCHQGHGFPLVADNKWHEIAIPVASVVGGERWGGANDGTWHGGAKHFAFIIGAGAAADKKPELFFRDIVADVKAEVAVSGERYEETFEKAGLPEGWTVTGPAGCARVCAVKDAFQGKGILRLNRTEDQLLADQAVEVLGAAFAAAPGPWSFGAAIRSQLHSPDNSFTVRLHVDALDANGGRLERFTLIDQCKGETWKMLSREIELPAKTAKARFAAVYYKTHGTCDLDALSAVPLEAKSEEKLVERIYIDGRKMGDDGRKKTNGHLFFPEETVEFDITALCSRPLPAESRTAKVSITDYWGAEQQDAVMLALERAPRQNNLFAYTGHLVLDKAKYEEGKYFEVHVGVSPKGYADASEYSAFARLPEAVTHRYAPREIPFQIRNWDSRIREYFDLANRIGHRNIGLWGDSGWDYVEKLGAGWYTGGFAGEVEHNGWKNTTPEKVYQNTFDLISKHKDDNFWFICQGNEPNERPEKAQEKVEAYEQVYKAAHAAKPDIVVVGTSVPALDCFFEKGFGKWCDVYDYHVYETYEGVRQGVRNYKALGKKYGCEKPIWCTELGLNSQGQTRYAVAKEVVKKITAFFAEGGANVSWFTIQYPDTDGKARGSGGDAHNTFDCQYNLFNPRLDAIMYYNMINGICVKKFFDEVQFEDGVQEFLFRDDKTGECLFVAWKEGERVDRGIALPGATDLVLTRVDGSHQPLTLDDRGAITLGLSGEPVMVSFKQAKATKLSRQHAPAAIAVDPAQPLAILKGKTRSFRVTGPGLKNIELSLVLPPRWFAESQQDGEGAVVVTVSAPAETDARTGRVMVQRHPFAAGKTDPFAEIILDLPIMSPVSAETFALGRDASGEPGLRVAIANNGAEPKEISWSIELVDSWKIKNCSFALQQPGSLNAYLKGENEGHATLAAGEKRDLVARIADFEPQTIYRVRTTVVDDLGRRTVSERYAGGFASAVRVKKGDVTIDGKGDESFWAAALPEQVGVEPGETFRYGGDHPAWKGPQDLSATWKAAWNEDNLYLLVEVTDDVYRVPLCDGMLWNQDGLQFLFDSFRTSSEKNGKYDYSAGVGTKGPQAWCHLTAHNSVLEGAAPWKIAEEKLGGGSRRYEIAIPWTALAPFQPAAGANLGMGMILNEDDGNGRFGYTGWFSGPASKDLDHVGDVVLLP